jgi:hypothetical protein
MAISDQKKIEPNQDPKGAQLLTKTLADSRNLRLWTFSSYI